MILHNHVTATANVLQKSIIQQANVIEIIATLMCHHLYWVFIHYKIKTLTQPWFTI